MIVDCRTRVWGNTSLPMNEVVAEADRLQLPSAFFKGEIVIRQSTGEALLILGGNFTGKSLLASMLLGFDGGSEPYYESNWVYGGGDPAFAYIDKSQHYICRGHHTQQYFWYRSYLTTEITALESHSGGEQPIPSKLSQVIFLERTDSEHTGRLRKLYESESRPHSGFWGTWTDLGIVRTVQLASLNRMEVLRDLTEEFW